MKLTKKQKGYLAVLAVALVAFLADRLFFLPASANADDVVQEDPSNLLIRPAGGGPSAAAVAAASAAGNPYRVDLLGERLSATAAERRVLLSAGVRDAFVPSAAWVARPSVVTHDTAAEAAQAFRDRHKLTAIFVGPSGRTAIVNGRSLREGQRLGAFTLTTIDARSITFTSGGHRVELSLGSESSINAE